ncbi:MAG: DUF4157 domain-containing protein [Nannocystaceae bacterium]
MARTAKSDPIGAQARREAPRDPRGTDERREAVADASELQRRIGNRATIQRLAGAGEGDPGGAASIDAIARGGASGSSRPLPFLDRIRASFGRHDLSHVRAFTGPAASDASRALEARAYTRGSSVVFGRTPDLRTAAHEAAHVIQQRAGVQLKGEVGEAGDAHERHADAVAERVVTGRSAEALLDRYACAPAAPVQPVIQRWGEPDHYAMGQRAGVKAVQVLDPLDTERKRTYRLEEEETDLSERVDFEGATDDPKEVVQVDVPSSDKFFLRGPEGDTMSLGAANRFAGDFTKKPLDSDMLHKAGSLDDMPKTISTKFIEEAEKTVSKPDTRVHREYLKAAGEKMLMATNANHFFPLSTIEYRRQHAKALQKVWVARRLWARGDALTRSDDEEQRAKGKAQTERAEEVFRQAAIVEGFAGHFLADCFAAGHLAPHALARIGDKSPVTAGARVNTWHDLFNALPNGIPTTLGTFHGDYSMDGNDLEYVSGVIAQSLLEVVMPWYTGLPYDGNVVTPAPDVAAIRADPVAGPLWRTMCGDYDEFFKALGRSSGRRETKLSLSKYIVYATSAGSGVAKDELMPMIARHVFGVDTGLERTDALQDGRGIRGKVRSIVAALHQVLTWKAGVQVATGLGQDYRSVRGKALEDKYWMSLRSRQLAKFSPTTNPRKALIEELTYWTFAWRSELKTRADAAAAERSLSAQVGELRGLSDSVKDKERKAWVDKIEAILGGFEALDGFFDLESPTTAPLALVDQGPDAAPSPDTSSGIAVQPTRALLALPDLDLVGVVDYAAALHALVSDPRPSDDSDHDELYDLLIADTRELADGHLVAYRAGVLDGRSSIALYTFAKTMQFFVSTLTRLKASGRSLKKTRKETFRRDAIKSVRATLSAYFSIDDARLMLTTGRVVP